MSAGADKTVSFSFMGLDALMKSFSSPVRTAEETDLAYQIVQELGELAVPSLIRKLCANETSASWAASLLLHLSECSALAPRVIQDVEVLCADQSLPDGVKIRVAGLFSTLNQSCDFLPTLADPDTTAEHSLDALAQCLRSASEIAQAADLLVSDMLGTAELVAFLEELAGQHAVSASLLGTELVSRGDLELSTRQAIWRLGQLAQTGNLAGNPGHLSGNAPRPASTIARHRSGRTAIICSQRIANQPVTHFRAISVLLSTQGQFEQCEYLEQATQAEIDRWLIDPLLEHEYQLDSVEAEEARGLATGSLRRRDHDCPPLSSDYYLGRDLLGLRHEHQSDQERRAIASSDRLARRIGMARLAR